MNSFERGKYYSRPDVKESVGLKRDAKGGNWDTGLVEHDGEFFIFANVGAEGRTGHNYENSWDGKLLRWYCKNKSNLGWDSVQRLLERSKIIHVFWRNSNTDPFMYAGNARAVDIVDTSPVEIVWSFDTENQVEPLVQSPEQIMRGKYPEGAATKILVNTYERRRSARQACLEHFGYVCVVCGFSFKSRYGSIGDGFIHVHHIVPLSNIGTEYNVDPVRDLRPVCPNCHAMIHRRCPPYTIEDMKNLLAT